MDFRNCKRFVELKRTFAYIAPVVFVERDSCLEIECAEGREDKDASYVIPLRMTVRLHRRYWDDEDAQAHQLWTEAMEPWLKNTFTKMSGAMEAFSRMELPGIENGVRFGLLEIQFDDDAVVEIMLGNDSSIPGNALEIVNAQRMRKDG